MIGREKQTKSLIKYLNLKKSVFLAVTGRRRVGKTYLVDTVYKDHFCFSMTGIQHAGTQEQLVNFSTKLQKYTGTPYITPPNNWQEAFIQLTGYLETLDSEAKKVIFIDELPWIHTAKSNFLQLLGHFWNDFLSKQKNYVLIVCGSATSWLTKHLINDVGGLHNRLKDTIYVEPFTLSETKKFLESRYVRLTNDGIMKIYMAMGGIPYYLEFLEKGDTPTTAIERILYRKDAPLRNEYRNLYKALFENAANHEAIVAALASSHGGISRAELIKKSKVKSGGPYNRAMEDLLVSGFVEEEVPFGRKKRGSLYKLVDEYSIFYHRFIIKNKRPSLGEWQTISNSQSYKIWLGYAFESLVMKHMDRLKYGLGIPAVLTSVSSFRKAGNKSEGGFQIDIVIQRKDNVIHLCECKYYNVPFTVDKKYALQLELRKEQFREITKTKDQLLTTFITNKSLVENIYANEYVDKEVLGDVFFE